MSSSPIALITGASQGLGGAWAAELLRLGWEVVGDARDDVRLRQSLPSARAVPGDVTDPAHRAALVDAVGGRLDLLVNNASELGPSPLPTLAAIALPAVRTVFETNVLAPLALTQALLPALRSAGGTIVNVSSDAAVSAYPGWGGYGASKAALDQLSAVLAVEEPEVRVYAVDPGDLRTAMHQRAFPGEDISDRQDPQGIVPALLRLVRERPASGRYLAADWAVDARLVHQ